MSWTTEHWAGLAVLAVLTFGLRLLGPWLVRRARPSPGTAGGDGADSRLLSLLAVAVLAGLVVTSAVFDGRDAAGWARPLGVAVAGVLVWRRAPFLVVVLAAAATTAVLRLLGLP